MRAAIDHVTPERIAEGVARVRELVAGAAARSGRSPDDVRLLAAVKYVDPAVCGHLVDAGIVDLAESRYDQLVGKQDSGLVAAAARWHYIGRLQSRQAPRVAARAAAIHTLCTASAASRLARVDGSLPELLVQVNVDGDPGKDGLAPDDVERFLLQLPDSLTVSGLMAMPAFATDPERSRPAFAALRRLRDRVGAAVAGRHEVRWLSMGTSQDVAVAVEEGATHVRLGRILYGGAE